MKLLQNPIVVGVLAVAALGLVGYQLAGSRMLRGFSFGGSKAGGTTNATAAAVSPTNPAAAALVNPSRPGHLLEEGLLPLKPVEVAAIEPKFKVWVSAPGRDPFLLLEPASPDADLLSGADTNSPVATWSLKAIWNQTDSRLAVINNRVYRAGDEVEPGYKVQRIEQNEVWIQGPRLNERLGFKNLKEPAPPAPPEDPAKPRRNTRV